jgi:GNAT superfamily N-acetyltransferase
MVDFISSILTIEDIKDHGGVFLKEIQTNNTLDVSIKHCGKVVAHLCCSHVNDEIHIRDLFVLRKFRNKGLGDVLLLKVQEYGAEKQAARIVSYCGAEPFCEDGQMPLEHEITWYKNHGFSHDHDVMGITPCMVKPL